jgi:hypothetical protein
MAAEALSKAASAFAALLAKGAAVTSEVSSVLWLETSYPERSAPHYSRWLRNGTAWPTSKSVPLTARTGKAVVI